jgi:predicted glycoside hydrolase/deacetylase ChbG (UPF0249 family)
LAGYSSTHAAVVTTDETRLIINADDFGLSEGINRGILEAFDAGALRSTSIMVGAPAFEDAVRGACAAGHRLGVGLHFTLTAGRPLTRSPSLTDEPGDFLTPVALLGRALRGGVVANEVAAECMAQIARARAAGIRLTHLDGHHHAHLVPRIAATVRRVVEAERIPAVRRPSESLFRPSNWWRRVPQRILIGALELLNDPRDWPTRTTDHFVGSALLGDSRFHERLLEALQSLERGTTELMVHPGYVDGPLPDDDSYTSEREVELRALLSADVLGRLHGGKIRLTHFGEL